MLGSLLKLFFVVLTLKLSRPSRYDKDDRKSVTARCRLLRRPMRQTSAMLSQGNQYTTIGLRGDQLKFPQFNKDSQFSNFLFLLEESVQSLSQGSFTFLECRGGLDRWSVCQIIVGILWRSVVRIQLEACVWYLKDRLCLTHLSDLLLGNHNNKGYKGSSQKFRAEVDVLNPLIMGISVVT